MSKTRLIFWTCLLILAAEVVANNSAEAGSRRYRKAYWIMSDPCSQPATTATIDSPIAAPTPPKVALYERLGGESAITAVVDEFVARAVSNPKVNFTRAGTAVEWKVTEAGVAKLKKHLVQLVCAVSGGPQKYEGRDMKSAHAGMKITNAEFGALAGDLIGALKKFNVPQAEIDELVKIVAGTRTDIVELP